jgi:hypothetical protein
LSKQAEHVPGSVQVFIREIQEFALDQLKHVKNALKAELEAAKFELSRHPGCGILMRPTLHHGENLYTAEGAWNLLGKFKGRLSGAAL